MSGIGIRCPQFLFYFSLHLFIRDFDMDLGRRALGWTGLDRTELGVGGR